MPTNADLIGRGLARWVAFVLRFPKTIIVIGLLAAGLCLHYAAGTLGINTDTANMISPELPWRQDFTRYRDSFPIRDRNLVVLIDGPTPRRADAFAAALADRLRAAPERYDAVFLAGDGPFFERNGLMYLSLAELEALGDRLVAAQPLLGLVQTRFDGAGIVEIIGRTLDERDAAAGADALERLYEEVAQALAAAAEGERDELAWERLFDAGGGDSTRRMILLQPELDFSRIRPAAEAIEGIRALVETLNAELDADVRVRLTGTVAMEHEELVSVTRGASLAGVLALVLVTAVLYWALRSVRLLIVSVTTLLAGLAGTAAFAAAAVGHLNLLSVAFAVLYVGLGVDFILHLCLRLNELRRQGHALETSLVESARGVGSSLVICAVTTAAGFYAFIPTPFEGVSELGLISGTGMFVSLAASLTLLPAMLAVFAPARAGPSAAGADLGGRLGRAVTARPRVVALGCAAAALGTFLGWPGVEFDSNPIRLRDPNAESIQAIEELAAESEAPLLNVIALADDAATAERWAESLAALPLVREVRTIDTLVPPEQDEKRFVLEDLALLLGPRFAEVEPRAADGAALRAELEHLAGALADAAPFTRAEAALDVAVRRFLEGTDGTGDPRLHTLDTALRSDLPAQLAELETALGAEPFGRADLPRELAARWTSARGEHLIEIVPAENVNDNEAAERFVDAVRAVVPSATGLPVVYREASATVVYSFRLALSYALVIIATLLFAFMRRAGDVLLVIGPIIVAAGATAGLTGLLGMPFNFANIIALPLLVGVGVDSGIHMVHRMRTEPPRDGAALGTSTSRAVLASGLTTIASFGNLAFSPHVGMASMGKLLTLGMLATIAATLVLLPALLSLRART